jgi:hypothetical protein
MTILRWLGGDTGAENDWSAAANWEPSGPPSSGDDAIIENDDFSIDPFDASATQLDSLTVYSTFTGTIGSETVPLQIGADVSHLHYSATEEGAGSRRLNFDFGSGGNINNVYGSASSSLDDGKAPIRVLATGSSNRLNHYAGTMSVAANESETSEFQHINHVNGDLTLGKGVEVTNTMTCAGGTIKSLDKDSSPNKAYFLITINGGNVEINGSSTITTVNIWGNQSRLTHKGTGTITNLNSSGIFDRTGIPDLITIDTVKLFANAQMKLKTNLANSVTFTNPIDLTGGGCSIQDIVIETEVGNDLSFT